MKKIPCLLALALFIPSLQACRSEAAKSEPNATPATRNQTSPRSDSQQPNETVVPAPSTFREGFDGTIDDKRYVYMTLERKDADLTGRYFYLNPPKNTPSIAEGLDGDEFGVVGASPTINSAFKAH